VTQPQLSQTALAQKETQSIAFFALLHKHNIFPTPHG